jgi:hypothetical protein
VGEIKELVGDFVVVCASINFQTPNHQMVHILQTEGIGNW